MTEVDALSAHFIWNFLREIPTSEEKTSTPLHLCLILLDAKTYACTSRTFRRLGPTLVDIFYIQVTVMLSVKPCFKIMHLQLLSSSQDLGKSEMSLDQKKLFEI